MRHHIAIQICSSIDPVQAQQEADALSLKYQLPLSHTLSPSPEVTLGWHRTPKDPTPKLALFQPESGAVFIDFLSGKKAHRRQYGGGKNQPLIRAMGQTSTHVPHIIDATAGMGGDSFVLASLGFHVLMLERSIAVFALLEDALERAQHHLKTTHSDPELHHTIKRLSLAHMDATQFLHQQACSPTYPVDVVYLDPMYPEKKKNAATKKEMRVLQRLLGPDQDSRELLNTALHTASCRVVVKRPKHAPIIELDNPKLIPTTHLSSPNTRYDVYVIKALKSAGLL